MKLAGTDGLVTHFIDNLNPAMHITATIKNEFQVNDVTVSTEGKPKKIEVPGRSEGFGSSVNGGELLFLALATCFCNDLYREAAKQNVQIASVEVTVSGEFGKEGEPASNIKYTVNVQAPTLSDTEIAALISKVDKLAEIHNTLRKGVPVSLNTAT